MINLNQLQKNVLNTVLESIIKVLEPGPTKNKQFFNVYAELDQIQINALIRIKQEVQDESNFPDIRAIKSIWLFLGEYQKVIGVSGFDKNDICVYHYANIKGVDADKFSQLLIKKTKKAFNKAAFNDFREIYELL